jgi:hypothetical protein
MGAISALLLSSRRPYQSAPRRAVLFDAGKLGIKSGEGFYAGYPKP